MKKCIKEIKKEMEAPRDLVQIMIVDFEMPLMTGLAVVREVKAFVNDANKERLGPSADSAFLVMNP